MTAVAPDSSNNLKDLKDFKDFKDLNEGAQRKTTAAMPPHSNGKRILLNLCSLGDKNFYFCAV